MENHISCDMWAHLVELVNRHQPRLVRDCQSLSLMVKAGSILTTSEILG